MSENLHIRPYARLLTMLGDQLIKNEKIALMELIKNSYDADATWVKISFEGFGNNLAALTDSKIVIEDNGEGMTEDVMRTDWLSPATPVKKNRKIKKATTRKGRVIQGEKGIGRFAILKLGKDITITTRPKSCDSEYVLRMNFSRFDDEFLTENGKPKELFLEDLTATFTERAPQSIVNSPLTLSGHSVRRGSSGTRIEIRGLKGTWSDHRVSDIFNDAIRLQSIFSDGVVSNSQRAVAAANRDEFEIYFYDGPKEYQFTDRYLADLRELLATRSVIRVEKGKYDEQAKQFTFTLDNQKQILKLSDPAIRGLKVFRDHFKNLAEEPAEPKTSCGSFEFGFYVFDFSSQAPAKYDLDKTEKDLIRPHRIYLYRDGIRVYPYGDLDDDWLRIDAYRGTIAAGMFLSNDQVVGYVNISQQANPDLKDKTNREGLIETGTATGDFIALLQTFLAYLRAKPYAQYRLGLKNKKTMAAFRDEQIASDLGKLRQELEAKPAIKALVDRVEQQYRAERSYLEQRAETTEALAGVGLSVETASHDIMAVMQKALIALDTLIKAAIRPGALDREVFTAGLNSLRGMLSFIETNLKDIQLLFKSSKQRRRDLRVLDSVHKVVPLFDSLLKKSNIKLDIRETGDGPLVAKTTDSVLLQVLLNLIDNSIYWLQAIGRKDKRILIQLDGSHGTLIVSDNGPGIRKEDEKFIFEPFFSGKGEEGRGLGLYIARQLLERQDFAIEYADIKAHRLLQGANFVVSFVRE
jgi:signal transduction histidine kinase